MNTGAKAAIIGGGVIIAGSLAYALIPKAAATGSQFVLVTSAGVGGTINPNSVSGIPEPAGSTVTVTITADSGYTIGEVLEDGVQINSSTTDTTETYQIAMNQDHEIDVTFYPGGSPPSGAPVQIVTPQNTIATGFYGCQISVNSLDYIDKCVVEVSDANYVLGNWVDYPVTFKVIDANGNGVPNVPMAFYPNLNPDTSKYQGYIALNDQVTINNKNISASNPLTAIGTTGKDANGNSMVTDANGELTIQVSYFYGLNDNLKTLCNDAGLYVEGIVPPNPLPNPYGVYNGWNGLYDNFAGILLTGKGGEKTVPAVPTPNQIVGLVPGTSIPQAEAEVYCQLHAKML